MMNRRCVGFLAGCVILFAPAVRAVAAGEGLQLGPTLVYPVLSINGTYDDNIHLVSQNPDSGWVMTLSPSLRIVMPVRRFYLNVEGGLDIQNFYGIDQGNYSDWFVGAAVGADLPGGLSFKIDDRQSSRFLLGSQEYGVGLDQYALTNGENYTLNTLNATVAYTIRNALKVEISGIRSAQSYSVSKRRQRVETTVQADLYWKFRPTISGFVEGSYTDYGYDTNTTQDNSATQAALGLTWNVTAKSTGTVKAGFQWKRYNDQSQSLGTENASYSTVSAGLKHNFTRRTMLTVELSRASQESDFPENPYFLKNMVDASLMHRLTPKLYGRAGIRYGVDDYPRAATFDNPYDPASEQESGVRKDTTLAWSASLGFDMTRWLSLELEYGNGHRDSNFDTFDYDVNRVSLSAKAAF